MLSFKKRHGLNIIEDDVLSVFKEKSTESHEIKRGMSPDEIANVVSDRLIEVVKEQFEKVKLDFNESEK